MKILFPHRSKKTYFAHAKAIPYISTFPFYINRKSHEFYKMFFTWKKMYL